LAQFVDLSGLLQLPCDVVVVQSRNAILFALADPIAQIVGFLDVLCRQTGLSQIAVHETQTGVGDGELRIEFESASIERNSLGISLGSKSGDAHTESLQGFQRGRRRFHRDIELLYCGQRFAQFAAQVGGSFIQGFQHVLLVCRLFLFLSQRVPVAATNGIYANHVLPAEVRN